MICLLALSVFRDGWTDKDEYCDGGLALMFSLAAKDVREEDEL